MKDKLCAGKVTGRHFEQQPEPGWRVCATAKQLGMNRYNFKQLIWGQPFIEVSTVVLLAHYFILAGKAEA